MSPILEVRDLHKTFPNGKKAVRGLSFSIPRGICFGLLGPNGAGKTTTIEICEGILNADSGSVFFEGAPRDAKFKQRTGIQFQETALQDFLRVRDVIEVFSNFYDKNFDLEELKALCQLNDIWMQDHKKLSGGQRQRLLLALALVNDPDLVFLDEPTTGLDPSARRNFWHLIETIKARGKTIVLTTHYMEEAQILCDAIAIVDQGKIIEEGASLKLLEKHFPRDSKKNLEDLFLKLTGKGLNQ